MTVSWMRKLPNGKSISALGFGCSSLWAKPEFDERRARDVLEVALSNGITHFDTSPSYGHGLAEERLGRFLQAHKPAELVISTKVGNNLVDGQMVRGFTRDLMERSFEGSLKRLGVDRVDILYLHGPSPTELASDDVRRFFSDKKAAGRISYAGAESRLPDVIARIGETDIDAVMPHFNVGHQSIGPDLTRLHAMGKFIISGTVLAQMKFDLRTFVPTNRNSLWYLLRMAKNDPLFWWRGPALARNLRQQGRTPREAAIAFVATHPAVTSGLFGSSNAEHVAQNAITGQQVTGS